MKIKKTVALHRVHEVDIVLEMPGINRAPEYVQISMPVEIEFELIDVEKQEKLAALDSKIEELKKSIAELEQKRAEL